MATMRAMAEVADPMTQELAAGGLSVEIIHDLAAAESLWRSLEIDGVLSPFQRYDWVASWAATAGRGDDIRVAVLREASGRPALLLPLAIRTVGSARIGSGIGGKHASFNRAIARAATMLDPADLRRGLQALGRELRLDLIVLIDCPASWNGERDALCRLGRPAPSVAYRLELWPDGEATLVRSMGRDARKKLRKKDRALGRLGRLEYFRARTAEQVGTITAAFFEQKHERFRALGVPDPFLAPEIKDFIRSGALAGLATGRPAIELYALTFDGRIIATFGGAADSHSLSGMFNSFDATSAEARFSPGDILIAQVVRDLCTAGRRSFDLGVGDARYKRTFCDERMALRTIVVPLTVKGRVYGAILDVAITLKARLKTSEVAMKALTSLRRWRAR